MLKKNPINSYFRIKKERKILTAAFEEALPIINTIIEGNWQKAMLDLHS